MILSNPADIEFFSSRLVLRSCLPRVQTSSNESEVEWKDAVVYRTESVSPTSTNTHTHVTSTLRFFSTTTSEVPKRRILVPVAPILHYLQSQQPYLLMVQLALRFETTQSQM